MLAPSERYAEGEQIKHKKVTDWARQLLLLKRWLPKRKVIAVGDSSYAVIDLLAPLGGHVAFITRLRLDAGLPARGPGKPGRNRKKGERLPTLQQVLTDAATPWQKVKLTNWYGHSEIGLEVATATALWYHSGKPAVPRRWVLLRDPEAKRAPVALLSTDFELSAELIITYFARRWAVEVTLQETRAHLGVETQRQWSEKAIERTTPVLLALFSIITLVADRLQKQGKTAAK